MSKQVLTGLQKLIDSKELQNKYTGNIGLLCHSASVDKNYDHSLVKFIEMFGKKVVKVFGPQHGFVSDVQDNMIETDHFTHPYFNLPVYSLYSETRKPTDAMLEGIDHLFIDLQDVGTRIYTYIYTMTYVLEACANKNIEVIILDRPNPVNAQDVEGNVLDTNFASFVGRHPIPVRHGLTMGEVARMHQKYWTDKKCKIDIIKMEGYTRNMYFEHTLLPWVMPSPNLPTSEGCLTFVGTVLFEGTNISEGRGTTRSLEIIGHPKINPWTFKTKMDEVFKENCLSGFVLRPINFQPTFQKHAGITCGGFQIHVTDRQTFKPWRVSQILCRELRNILGEDFKYKEDAYEYGKGQHPLDMINGTDKLRTWLENNGSLQDLNSIEFEHLSKYLEQRKEIIIY
jgi:uncharacterized protein YbbC (DUF1343 family)